MLDQKPIQIPQTSIVDRKDAPPVTVEFMRWTAFRHSAYQRGQRAGFNEEEAQRLEKSGRAKIVHRA